MLDKRYIVHVKLKPPPIIKSVAISLARSLSSLSAAVVIHTRPKRITGKRRRLFRNRFLLKLKR